MVRAMMRPVKALAVVAVCAALVLLALALPMPALAQSQPAQTLRPPVAALLQSVQAQLAAGKPQEALAAWRDLERKVPDTSNYERYIALRVRAAVMVALGDDAAAAADTEAALATQLATPEDRLVMWAQLSAFATKLNRPQAALQWATAYVQAGGQDDAVRAALVRAALALGQCKPVVEQLAVLVTKAERQGNKPPEAQLRAAAACQAKLSDDDGYYRALERLLQHYPSPAYWADAIARLQRRAGFHDRLLLDTFRLMRHVGVLQDPDDLMSTAQLAVEASLPGEARAVLQAGFEAGILGKGPGASVQQSLLVRAQKLAQAEAAQFEEAVAQAQRQSDGRQLFLLGQAALFEGQAERGVRLMEAALERGLARQPDDARLRLAVALVAVGRRSDAGRLFSALPERDGLSDLARLWLLALR
jgi:hypothetical protein